MTTGERKDFDQQIRALRSPCAEDVARVMSELKECGISAWLHGGWAVEALLGQALFHEDIDLLVRASQRRRLETQFGERIVFIRPEYTVILFDHVRVEFGFFQHYTTKLVSFVHRDILWLLPDPAAASCVANLAKTEVPVVPAAVILAEQEHTVRKKKKAVPKMQERAVLLRCVLDPAVAKESRYNWPYKRNFWNMFLLQIRLLHLFGRH